MPYKVRKSPTGGYDILKVHATGPPKKVGHAATLSDAQASIRSREDASKQPRRRPPGPPNPPKPAHHRPVG